MDQVLVVDVTGRPLSPTSHDKALRLVRAGKAAFVREDPLTIQLNYEVKIPVRSEPEPSPLIGQGFRLLLHICCAPCSTYTVKRLRELGFEVTGYWYNPNIHPFGEHERRRETLVDYAGAIDLPMMWEQGYEIAEFLRAIHGRERFRVRCQVCYRMRLERAAQSAARAGLDAFTTTLLISPYQDQAALKAIGEEAASRWGVQFFFENLRRGWVEHFAMTRDSQLYSQRYCGCVYSEWEAHKSTASCSPQSRH
jgi:predicted adenine nucleotide alpha hydrolase (AANH) superfamily ATPase